MILMGKWNWYMPKWLDKIVPNFSIEGQEYFDELDAKRGAAPPPVPAGVGGKA
jgi:hypothetical protein